MRVMISGKYLVRPVFSKVEPKNGVPKTFHPFRQGKLDNVDMRPGLVMTIAAKREGGNVIK